MVALWCGMVHSLRKTLFLAVLFLTVFAFANPLCEGVYRPSESGQKSVLNKDLERRLEVYFGEQWRSGGDLSDAQIAKDLFKKLNQRGTLLDLKFFDLYVSILESTSSRYDVRAPGFYIDLLMWFRPKSNFFQERHWDWSILDGYFFNAPLPVSIVKDQDFKYMQHILETAKELGRVSLREVLQKANHTWALKTISSTSKIGRLYNAYVENESYGQLSKKFRAKVKHWISSGRNEKERKTRAKIAQHPALAYESSNSYLDLFIMNKYFDLINTYGVSNQYWPHTDIPKWLQLTDWRVYEMALPYASMEYMNDFLFQNSHDIKAKEYLLKILVEMEATPIKKYGDFNGFYFGFLEARAHVDQRIIENNANHRYQSDLHIFTKRVQDADGIEAYDQIKVNWNPVFGRLQSNVVNYTMLKNDQLSTVSTDPQLRSNVNQYFDQLRKDKAFTAEEIDRDEQLELQAPLSNTTYLSFTRRGTERLLTMVRLFDGTVNKTYIEREFPHIILPRGENGEKTFELGRLFSKSEVQINSVRPVMAMVAEYLKMANVSGEVYFDCSRGPMKYYLSLGAEIVYTPEQLKIGDGQTRLWVMKFSVSDIIRIFSKPSYRAVRLKNSTPTDNQ